MFGAAALNFSSSCASKAVAVRTRIGPLEPARRGLGRIDRHHRLPPLRVDRRRRGRDGSGGKKLAPGRLCVAHGREP